eukprot:TRINITY_DN1325_c0_g1_i2.p1 TRINITY_DN1325_c0_g1~~TRINITY_DN1325_c0_g1_i2.p1  ORF type:complete len:450 (+),score=-9.81 TRINITY_DN1325_c0_g1_i2:51-1400(+)
MAYKISIESLYLLLLYNNKFKQMKPSFFFLLTLCTAFASDPIWEPPLDPLPNEEWESDSVDLGNGGDRTFYLLTKCKNCNIPPPLIMWLAGGPGGSSIPASYLEVGPYLFNTSYQLHKNPWAWTNHVDVMFVDNPVGVPFSIARDSTTLCRNETCVARNLYVLLSKFIHAHPEYRKRPFYLAGESYAGHYIPAFGKYLIKAKNPDINFVGAAVGNGMIDTYIQNPYIPDFLHKNHNISEVGYVLLKTAHLLCNSAKGIELFQRACDFIAIITAQWLKIPDPYDIKGDGKIIVCIVKIFGLYIIYLEDESWLCLFISMSLVVIFFRAITFLWHEAKALTNPKPHYIIGQVVNEQQLETQRMKDSQRHSISQCIIDFCLLKKHTQSKRILVKSFIRIRRTSIFNQYNKRDIILQELKPKNFYNKRLTILKYENQLNESSHCCLCISISWSH